MKKLLFVVGLLWSSMLMSQTTVVINEVNADNPGGPDTREFIELFGLPNESLDSLVVVFFDGATGLSYYAIDLDGRVCDAQGFFVMGNALATNVDLTFTNALFQNGADAVAIYHADAADFPNNTAPTGLNLIDAQVYGTADATATNLITGLTLNTLAPGYTQFDETVQTTGTDLTQSRIPDGGAAFAFGSYVLQALTPGTWNQPPCVGGTIASASVLSFCNNTPSTVDFTTTSTVGQYLYIIANAAGNIAATSTGSFDFNGLPVGTYTVRGFAYSGTLNAASVAVGAVAANATSSPCFSFSTNSLTINVNQCSGCNGGAITANGASASVTVISNAVADYLTFANTSSSQTATYAYLLADASGNILATVDGSFDFNSLATGSYQLVGISYEGSLINASNIQTVTGSTCGALSSNVITVQVIQINTVVINEINADNPGGADTAEFIELYGNANASLTGLVAVFFDGATGNSYAAYDLDGYSTDNFGFFVLGNVNAANVDLVFTNALLQNGADAVAIFIGNATDFPTGTPATANNLMDVQVYGTADATATNLITGFNLNTLAPGYTQFDETVQTTGTDLTQSRIPDGGAAFAFGSYVLQALTPGTWNQPPCVGGTIASVSALSFCNNTPSTVDFTTSSTVGQYLYIIADAAGNIAATSTGSIDFNGLPVGAYTVRGFSYSGTLDAASVAVGALASGASASVCSSYSTNSLTVNVNLCAGCNGGAITANGISASLTIISNAVSDYLTLANTSTSLTATYAYLLADASGNILATVDGSFDFNSLATGSYQLVGISYEGNLINAGNIQTVTGSTCGALSSNVIAIQILQINSVVINEVNADNPGGADTAEFIELYGNANASLNGLVAVFFDGAAGTSYAAFDLDGYSTDNNGFFVLGDANAVNVDLVFTNALLQNGADAVAIYVGNATDFPNGSATTANNLMDAQVYGTADATATNLITGLNLNVLAPGYTQFDETAQFAGTDLTQSRIPDGGAAFAFGSYVLQALTPGTWNQPPCNAGTMMWSDSTTTLTACDSQVGLNTWLNNGSTGNTLYIITDANGLILDTTSNASFNFAGWAVGDYQVHAMSYTGTIAAGSAAVGSLYSGVTTDVCFEHATMWLTLTINMCSGCGAGDISSASGSQVTVVADAQSDVINLTNTSTSITDTYVYALTDITANFIQWIPADFDFNSLANGLYEVYGLSYEGILTSPAVGTSINTVSATTCSAWTATPIQVNVITINSIVINELNADNPGGPDTAEFIEFYGNANATLDGLTVVLFDGTSGVSYAAYDLDGYSTDNSGFFMIGDAAVASSDIVINNATIQNGADAVAIYIGNATDFPNGTAPTPNNLMDAMVYGTGDATATNLITGLGLDVLVPGYTQFDETVQTTGIDLTQSRVPDGGPAFINSNVVLQELTPNTFNIVILGCMDTAACNYNDLATVNDNSCAYPGSVCDDNNPNSVNDVYNADCVCAGVIPNFGCMDIQSCNYNALANVDDGSCVYPGGTCNDGDSTTTVDIIDINCLCNGMPLMVMGCTDSTACNYNSAANTDDGSCIVPGAVCDDADSLTFNDVVTVDCSCIGTMTFMGCMDMSACNYDAAANTADGSCLYTGATCDDGNAATINDVITADCQCLGTVVGVEESTEMSWKVFPNPARNQVMIQSSEMIQQITIVDMTGRVVVNMNSVQKQMVEVNVSDLTAGIYYVNVTHDSGRKTKTLIIN